MRSFPHLILSCILCSATPSFAATQIYRYTDDAGTLTFTTELHKIPEPYRRRAVPLYGETTGTAGTVAPVQPQAPPPATQLITVGSDYRMGEHDTRTDAIRMAIESAKRQALEQAATYLESVTEVRHLDVTRDELRSYSAGILTVLDQRTSTRMEEGRLVIHVDITAQVDRHEVIQAITALRENESAKQQLMSLRAETDQLRQRLDAATQALASAESQEQIQALANERRQVLDQMQAASQAWTQVTYAFPGLVFRQAPPPHGSMPPPPVGVPVPLGTSLLVPPPAIPDHTHQPLPSPLAAPLSPSPLSAPMLQPTFPQIQPQGVPYGSLSRTPPPPAFPQIQPLGVPPGSLSQNPATPTFPQIQPLGVPHGSLSGGAYGGGYGR